MKNDRKKMTKIIGAILAVLLISSPLAYFSRPKASSNDEKSKVTAESAKDALVEHSIGEIKENVTKEDIKTKGNKVIGSVKVNENVNIKDAEKLIQQYSEDLSKKYDGKDINIEIIRDNEQIAKSSTYNNTKPSKAAPKYSVKIEKGLTVADSYVAVTLDGVDSKNYNIAVFNDILKYVPNKNFFHGIVTNINEEEILKNIKIMPKK